MKITVIGSGSWGTAIAGQAAAHVDEVCVWSFGGEAVEGINGHHRNNIYLTDYVLPDNVWATASYEEAIGGADGIILAVPSAFLRSVLECAAPFIKPETPVLTLTKGIEDGTGYLMSELVADCIGAPERIGVLAGPNHAEEVCRGCLSAAVIAAEDPAVAEFFKSVLLSDHFRIYVGSDLIGVEMCSAVKNVIAIVCGYLAGMGYGDNTLALVMTRGIAEISRLVHARGGSPITCMGLAGMGDLVVTCTSHHSRNRTFGESLAHGGTLEEYQKRTHMVVEGAAAAKSVAQLARNIGVDAPITFALEKVLWQGVSKETVFNELIDRFPTEEFYGMDD
ncbi:NAD(P)H-dependent glycerol-3-phosphate dehydrogenase [Collinsella ihumii]|uniref:NAD(P)H-dependent glycerol-3-phosphate dehydrogenase n=1 Tax=Collinsella ihumii TaxID=1720204 RepID=UPI0008361354|nr:NAD(P)H-dependent glycerol-3-phosphate dehydrogenase [Collinsella ihumii]